MEKKIIYRESETEKKRDKRKLNMLKNKIGQMKMDLVLDWQTINATAITTTPTNNTRKNFVAATVNYEVNVVKIQDS